jgi:hypothetical protein
VTIMLHEQKPPLDEALLVHYGVKGMHWGIRKEKPPSGVARFQAPKPAIASDLHPATKQAAVEVAKLMSERYGFHITEVKSITPDNNSFEWQMGTYGLVNLTPGRREGIIHARIGDLGPAMKNAEKIGWVKDGTGDERGLFTHESAHALFHADQTNVKESQARDKALEASIAEAKRMGVPPRKYIKNVSGYAKASGMRMETEAELFAQYHWSPNPPSFVKVWGETLHNEMGIDPTPFREAVKKNG